MLPELVSKILLPPLIAGYFMLQAGTQSIELKFPIQIDLRDGRLIITPVDQQGTATIPPPAVTPKQPEAAPRPKPSNGYTIEEFSTTYEIAFDAPPPKETRKELQEHGFRWNPKESHWYSKKTPETTDFLQNFNPNLSH